MDKVHYEEMVLNLDKLIQENVFHKKKIYLFGHCNATEELANLLIYRGYLITAILDNNTAKHENKYRGIAIQPPQIIASEVAEQTVVCIVARAYAAMFDQLRRLGYTGEVYKLVDYNSFAEYSLSKGTLIRKKERVERGIIRLHALEEKYSNFLKLLCPFSALGDIYMMTSYLPYFLRKRKIDNCVIVVVGNACAEVVHLFGDYAVEVMAQKDMDEAIQAALFTRNKNVFIPHQDRPYVVNLSKALYVKKITLERIYCCGVFALPVSTEPYRPLNLCEYGELDRIERGKAVVLSPYAKSVTALEQRIWNEIVEYYREKSFQCFTNVVGDEEALPGTIPISPAINEIQSVVERAGTFIGIRSGICDVLREAFCKKVALYPDYNYCDTKWKAIDIYWLEGWENYVAGEDFQWKGC
ncbi:MAG: hypothetical protein HFH61_01810 [Lachnospiraceae bacterium]|nr:hypothetical protein [Lachnospiraceae bacterium]